MPNWDQASQKKVRDALLDSRHHDSRFRGAFGTKEQVDPVRHLIGTAAAWGGNPDKDATYLNVTPAKNDGTTVYKLQRQGCAGRRLLVGQRLQRRRAITRRTRTTPIRSTTSRRRKAPDGSVAIQFGGCDGKIPNCLPIMKGWNYTVRLYRPRAEILNGKWKFPEPQPAN